MKITGNEVSMTVDEARAVCKLGKGSECCAFLAMGAGGFECIAKTSMASIINGRLAEGTMNAKGRGGWVGCAWSNHNN